MANIFFVATNVFGIFFMGSMLIFLYWGIIPNLRETTIYERVKSTYPYKVMVASGITTFILFLIGAFLCRS